MSRRACSYCSLVFFTWSSVLDTLSCSLRIYNRKNRLGRWVSIFLRNVRNELFEFFDGSNHDWKYFNLSRSFWLHLATHVLNYYWYFCKSIISSPYNNDYYNRRTKMRSAWNEPSSLFFTSTYVKRLELLNWAYGCA